MFILYHEFLVRFRFAISPLHVKKMYAAHSDLAKKQASQRNIDACLARLKAGHSDNDYLLALVAVTRCIRLAELTASDQRSVLQATGLDFVTRLLKSECLLPANSPLQYKAMALSLLSVWTTEPFVADNPAIKDCLLLINDVISLNNSFSERLRTDWAAMYCQMCQYSEQILLNLSRRKLGLHYLVESHTTSFMIDYCLSAYCQNIPTVLASLSHIILEMGEEAVQLNNDKFHALMEVAVSQLLHEKSSIQEKADLVKILTNFLNGISMIEVSVQAAWLRKLIPVLKQLMLMKMDPIDGQVVLDLVWALVSSAGPLVLSSEVAGDSILLKSVVARLSVEVYMELDKMTVANAQKRCKHLDVVYKFLSVIVQFVADTGESLDSESVILVYQKLVGISETIMEFLYSVAQQEIDLPKTHVVVLMSVRTLAAMLSEITENVTPRLLELMPFFNLLCQNVEYTEDVITEVKHATQSALANIKSMETDQIHNSEVKKLNSTISELSLTQLPETDNKLGNSDGASSSSNSLSQPTALKDSHMTEITAADAGDASNIKKDIREKTTVLSLEVLATGDIGNKADIISVDQNSSCAVKEKIELQPFVNVCLSQESIDSFRAFQESVRQTSAQHCRPDKRRKVSFVGRHEQSSEELENLDQQGDWKPKPNDVLGYLLPAYLCLMDNQEVLDVMVAGGTFNTIVEFLESSLSSFLEGRSSEYPETTSTNALTVVEQVYVNSPATTTRIACFQEFFEVAFLSLPNLLTLSEPPPMVCLKLSELTLDSFRIQMRDESRRSRLKHSQSRLFRAIVDYLSSFYEIHPHRSRPHTLHIRRDLRDLWPLAKDLWCGCVADLCALVRSVEELQDSLGKVSMLPDFLSYLASCDGPDFSNFSEAVQEVSESMLSLMEAAAEGSSSLCKLILHNQGLSIARKFGLQKLERCLSRLS